MSQDPGFATAVERAYLSLLAKMKPGIKSRESTHQDLMDRAIYKADPSTGGLRFKRLNNAIELEDRLFRALSNQNVSKE